MKDKGFTLIEIIITIVILGIIGVFTFTFFGRFTETYTTMRSKTNVHVDAYYALERISRELRDAKVVSINNNVIYFEKANPTGQDSNRYVRFYVNGNELYRDSANDSGFTTNITHNLLAKNVSTFTVSQSGTSDEQNQVITITIGVTSGESQEYKQEYKTDICPKNYTEAGNESCDFMGRSYGGCYEEKIN